MFSIYAAIRCNTTKISHFGQQKGSETNIQSANRQHCREAKSGKSCSTGTFGKSLVRASPKTQTKSNAQGLRSETNIQKELVPALALVYFMGDPELNKRHFGRKEPRGEPVKNTNPNARVNEIKARFGMAYNYRFLEIDNLQREFYFEMVRREKEERGKA